MKLLLSLAIATLTATAGEYAVLSNGFRIHADSHATEATANPYDPAQNVEAGARYLRDLLIKYENDPHQVSKAMAAYNAGPGAVDKYNGIPPYRETVQYVNRVLKQYEKEQQKKKPTGTD